MTNFYPASTFLARFETESDRSSAALPFRRISGDGSYADGHKQQLDAAFRQGMAEGRASALTECELLHAERLGLLRDAHAAERNSWVASEGGHLRKQLQDGLAAIELQIAEAAAAVIEPFIEEGVVRRAKADLGAKLREILADGRGCKIVARGPEDLLNYLKSIVPQAAESNFEVGPSELTVTICDTVLQTTLASWLNELRKDGNV